MRSLTLAIVLWALTGCAVHEGTPARGQLETAPSPWVMTLSPQQVSNLSPEDAKAILFARAAIEQQAKSAGAPSPQVLEYRVTDTRDGWEVHVQFVGLWDGGKPSPGPGYFSTVYINKDWTLRKIVGGA